MKRRTTISIGVVIVLISGFGVLALASFVRQIRRAPITQAEAESELSQITSPPGATVVQHTVINKGTHGGVGNYYSADLTDEQIRAYYDAELARHGWKFNKQIPLTSWGKDMGESQAFYCKGDRSADLYFTGREEPELGLRYALVISWGLYDCP